MGKKPRWGRQMGEAVVLSGFLYQVIWVRSNEQGEAHRTVVSNPAAHMVTDADLVALLQAQLLTPSLTFPFSNCMLASPLFYSASAWLLPAVA